jgi:hypothetical protein
MNIFYLDRDPVKAAQVQYNKHVVKMILESAQMLCTAHHHYDNGHNVPYIIMTTDITCHIKKHITIIRQLYGVGKMLANTNGSTIT